MKFHTLEAMAALRLLFLWIALPAASHKTASRSNDTAYFLDRDDRDHHIAGSGVGFFRKWFRSFESYLFQEDATSLECKNLFVRNDDVFSVIKDLGDEASVLEADTCFHPDVKRSSIAACLTVPDPSKHTVFIAGDSHAAVLRDGLKDSISWQVGYVGYANIAMPKKIDEIIDGLEKAVKPGDVVVWSENFVVLPVADYQAHVEKLKKLTAKKANVMLVGDVVSLPQDPELCLLRKLPCSKKRAEVDKQRKGFIDVIVRASENSFNKIWAMNLQTEFCTGDDCNMFITGTTTLGFMDRDHINRAASDYLGHKICTEIQKNLKAR